VTDIVDKRKRKKEKEMDFKKQPNDWATKQMRKYCDSCICKSAMFEKLPRKKKIDIINQENMSKFDIKDKFAFV
jgi:hypothetical protein